MYVPRPLAGSGWTSTPRLHCDPVVDSGGDIVVAAWAIVPRPLAGSGWTSTPRLHCDPVVDSGGDIVVGGLLYQYH